MLRRCVWKHVRRCKQCLGRSCVFSRGSLRRREEPARARADVGRIIDAGASTIGGPTSGAISLSDLLALRPRSHVHRVYPTRPKVYPTQGLRGAPRRYGSGPGRGTLFSWSGFTKQSPKFTKHVQKFNKHGGSAENNSFSEVLSQRGYICTEERRSAPHRFLFPAHVLCAKMGRSPLSGGLQIKQEGVYAPRGLQVRFGPLRGAKTNTPRASANAWEGVPPLPAGVADACSCCP